MKDFELLKKVVSIPSYVDKTTNEKEFADFLLSYLKENLSWLKVEKQIVEGDRYNIIATSCDNPEYVFVSHMDTVLPSSSDQLTPFEKDGRIYGRGSGDMKGGLIAALKSVEEVGEKSSVALIFDVDEEYYFKGVNKLIEEYSFSPKLAIFPEPSNEYIVNGCRGVIELQFNIRGKTAHAGSPNDGVNAIEQAVALVSTLKYLLNHYSDKDSFETSVNLASLKGGIFQEGEVVTQANAVADIAQIVLDIRPGNNFIDAQYVLDLVRSLAIKFEVNITDEKINLDYKSYFTTEDELKNFESILGNKYKDDLGGGGFFEAAIVANAWDCPSISYGPIGTAHTADEYLDIESYFRVKESFKKLLST